MQIGIPKESQPSETRVAATPQTVSQLHKLGFELLLESDAGLAASFNNADYENLGARIVDASAAWQADIVFKINAPSSHEIQRLKPGATLICLIWPAENPTLLEQLAERNINVLAMDAVPRISRAQSMDALSSMANIGGYRAVVEAAHEFGRFFTGQITAAGKVPPAKVLVIGAGVAGLAAIGAAGSLGAIVRAFDTRPEVAEQISSMGAEFLTVEIEEESGSGDGYAKQMSQAFIDAEMALFKEQAKDVDIIITTALIPGKPAPLLLTADIVSAMKAGSVIVDMAAQNGGNCELTTPGKKTITDNGVVILGYTDLPARLANQSSQLYSNNLLNLSKLLCPQKDGRLELNFNDEIIRSVTVVKACEETGEITWPPPPVKVSVTQPHKPTPKEVVDAHRHAEHKTSAGFKYPLLVIAALLFGWLANAAPPEFLSHFTVFVLACVVGYYVIWNVSHSLHTPLMSVTNAISGIIIVGALLQVGSANLLVSILAFIGVLIATVNIVGGFTVTRRMLNMFRK